MINSVPDSSPGQVLRENFQLLTHSRLTASVVGGRATRQYVCDSRSRLGRTKVGMPQSWLSNLTMMNVILGQLETQHANFRPGVIPFESLKLQNGTANNQTCEILR